MPTIITAGNAAARGYGFAGAAAVVPGLFTFTNFSAVNGSGTVNYLCGISYNPYYGRWVIGGRSSGNLPSWAGSADGVTWTTPATVGSVQLPNMTGVSQNSSTTTNYMAVFGATATGTGEYIYTSNGGTSFVASSSIISNAFLVTPTVATNSASGSGFVGRGSSNGLPYFVQSGFSGTAGSWAAISSTAYTFNCGTPTSTRGSIFYGNSPSTGYVYYTQTTLYSTFTAPAIINSNTAVAPMVAATNNGYSSGTQMAISSNGYVVSVGASGGFSGPTLALPSGVTWSKLVYCSVSGTGYWVAIGINSSSYPVYSYSSNTGSTWSAAVVVQATNTVTVTGAASDGSKIVIVGYNSSGIPVYSHS